MAALESEELDCNYILVARMRSVKEVSTETRWREGVGFYARVGMEGVLGPASEVTDFGEGFRGVGCRILEGEGTRNWRRWECLMRTCRGVSWWGLTMRCRRGGCREWLLRCRPARGGRLGLRCLTATVDAADGDAAAMDTAAARRVLQNLFVTEADLRPDPSAGIRHVDVHRGTPPQSIAT
jgi:hypothetical protein